MALSWNVRATVTCTCGKPFEPELAAEAATLTELGEVASGLLLAGHVADNHAGHALELTLQDVPEPKGCTLKLRCLYPGCTRGELVQTHSECPPWMVGALTICFHTSHEGHPLEVTFNDRTWRSPE